MNALYLIRHSLTAANEQRLYCGWTDLPLSPAGRRLALELRETRPLPACAARVTSGLARADETLALLTGRADRQSLPELREMNFGRFEMLDYERLKSDEDYLRWIGDEIGTVACPGGESAQQFNARVLRGGEALLKLPGEDALVVCHGGVIVRLMQAWFPEVERNFYEWQPGPCRGYRVQIRDGVPMAFDSL